MAKVNAKKRPPPPTKRGEQRREAFLEAARAVFLDKGYAAASIDDVGAAAAKAGTKAAGVVIEHLDAQAGTWQFSMDEGQTWRAIRTDLINRDGNLGLALDCDARLRVLPFGGHRVSGVRVAFHTVQRRHGQGNGSYRAYASDEREDGCSRTVTLVLGLSAINGAPPAVHVPRPRNKRALVQRAAAAAGAAGTSLSGSMALA